MNGDVDDDHLPGVGFKAQLSYFAALSSLHTPLSHLAHAPATHSLSPVHLCFYRSFTAMLRSHFVLQHSSLTHSSPTGREICR